MTKKIFWLIFPILAGALLDAVVAPFLVGHHEGFHFVAVVVSIIGLRSGWIAGLASGWAGGIVLASLSNSPLGLYMLSLGITGYVGGILRQFVLRRIPWLAAFAIVCLVFLEDIIAGLAASLYLGASWRVSVPGVLFSTATVLLIFWQPLKTSLGEET